MPGTKKLILVKCLMTKSGIVLRRYVIHNGLLYRNRGNPTGILTVRVMRVGSDTFGDPIFQKGLKN